MSQETWDRPGGKLLVETMHRDRLAAIFRPRQWQRVPDGLLLEERSFDLVTGVNETLHELRPDDGDPISLTYRVRTHTATEVVALAEGAGFRDVRAYGGLGGGPLAIETRLVVVATA